MLALRCGQMSGVRGWRSETNEQESLDSPILSITVTFSKNITVQIKKKKTNEKLRVGGCYQILDIITYSVLFKVLKHLGVFITSLFFTLRGGNATSEE